MSAQPRRPGRLYRVDTQDKAYPMRAALPPRAEVIAPERKTWPLRRRDQLDQGDTPHCVAYTGKHWERSLPIHTMSGLGPTELYVRCKAIDGDDRPGTDARSLMKVYQALGKVGAYHWYTGDDEELKLWLLTKGPAWFGCYLSTEMWTQNPGTGLWGVNTQPNFELGHEMCLQGYNRKVDEVYGVQSWEHHWGNTGRWRMRWVDFHRFLEQGGDCVGAAEVRP